MTEYYQENPFSVQIEPVEGCNLRCGFCGLNGIRGKENNYKMMSLETATKIAEGMKEQRWTSRIEFAMHGEPTFNDDLHEIIKVFRKNLPKANLMMLSNGGNIIKDPLRMITEYFSSGLDTLGLDEYQQISLVPKIWKRLFEGNNQGVPIEEIGAGQVFFNDVSVWVYPDFGDGGNPHKRVKTKRLIRISPIDLQTKGTHSNLTNHTGAGAPKNNKKMGIRCAKPFREISFRYDGSVAICCNDWRGEFMIGSINDLSLKELWHHERFKAARKKLYYGERDFGACDGCDAMSYRLGFLPDKKGLDSLDRVNAEEELLIKEVEALKTKADVFLRDWEK